jgi:elongation factor P
MLNISDLKIGTKIIYNNAPCEIIYTEHSKLGRGGSILRTKIKNLIDGSTVEKTFAGAEKVDEAELQMKKAQYLYSDEEKCYFMDGTDFEQFEILKKQIGAKIKFLKEGENIDILYFDDAPINIQLPIKIKFKITYTEPGFKGNTTSTALKPATIETGAQINVPLFIKENDEIIIDTRTGQYVERA